MPRWCPAPGSAGRHHRLPRQQINASLPFLLLPIRLSQHPSGRWGGDPGGSPSGEDAGAHHLLPAPDGVEEDGESGLIPLIPFPCLWEDLGPARGEMRF